jgi:tetratricopeptide (TPR) repeat protein
MTQTRTDVAPLSDVTSRGRRKAIREHFDIGAFGVNAFTADGGERVINEHDETGSSGPGQEELYFVFSGEALFTVDGEEVAAPAGTFVFVPDPAAKRGATAREDDTTVLAVGAPRGEAYSVSPWEDSANFWPHYEAGDYERAIEVLTAYLEENPDHRGTLYNLACCESLAGRKEEALDHLGRALELDDGGLRDFARTDSDFEPLHGDAAFERLVAGAEGTEEPSGQAPGRPAGGERRYRAAHLSEIQKQPGSEGSTWIRVRRHLDVGGFGVNAYSPGEATRRVIEDHTESGPAAGRHEELYLVTQGRARFTVGDEELDAPAGTLVFVRDPETNRGAVAEDSDTTVLALGGKRGEAYEVAAWEDFADAWPHYRAKEYDRAIEIFGQALERHPDNPSGLYNLACCESLSGRPDEAIEHLTRAVELNEPFREYAKTDSDFDPVRDDPRFAALVGG